MWSIKIIEIDQKSCYDTSQDKSDYWEEYDSIWEEMSIPEVIQEKINWKSEGF